MELWASLLRRGVAPRGLKVPDSMVLFCVSKAASAAVTPGSISPERGSRPRPPPHLLLLLGRHSDRPSADVTARQRHSPYDATSGFRPAARCSPPFPPCSAPRTTFPSMLFARPPLGGATLSRGVRRKVYASPGWPRWGGEPGRGAGRSERPVAAERSGRRGALRTGGRTEGRAARGARSDGNEVRGAPQALCSRHRLVARPGKAQPCRGSWGSCSGPAPAGRARERARLLRRPSNGCGIRRRC